MQSNSTAQGVAPEQAVARHHHRDLSEVTLSGVYEISKILVAPAKIETTLANVLNLLSSFMDMRNGTIMLLNDEDVPDIVIGTCWSAEVATMNRQSLPQKALDQIVATRMPLIVQSTAGHELFDDCYLASPDTEENVAFIGVPIRIGNKVAGTLTIDRPWRHLSGLRLDHDVRLLSMVANLLGQTIHLQSIVARDRERLLQEQRRLEKQLEASQPVATKSKVNISGIIGNSQLIRNLLDKIATVAASNATVLLRGESGTGKELFARAIHELSPRVKGPFVRVNCAALPESVLESELFGHEKGAFTGATSARKGRFELADGGTLFLDEIGEISPAFQAKLLRVLQEGEFDRVGSSKTQKVNVRIVAATNRNLEEAVSKGDFRADLYYRINVVPLLLPALRDRKCDIPLLAQNFVTRFNEENGRSLSLSPTALNVLKSCYFPGNVRELENCIRRTATLTRGDTIEAADFACGHGECLSATLWKGHGPSEASFAFQPGREAQFASAGGTPAAGENVVPCTCGASQPGGSGCPTPEECSDIGAGGDMRLSRAQLVDAMERSGWVQAKAARLLGITPRQIGYALKKHNVSIKRL
ncbi:MAG: nif-specific transcriptional activator NifA [Alphaproteobacteria bacterium]